MKNLQDVAAEDQGAHLSDRWSETNPRRKVIWYAHYPGDYGRDTAHLSLAQHGAYRLLLDHYYSTGAPLTSDLKSVQRICRAFEPSEIEAVAYVLAHFFDPREDGYHNSRADLELAKQAEIREERSKRGKTGANHRWHRHIPSNSTADATANATAIANPQSHPQSQSSVTPIAESREESNARAAQAKVLRKWKEA
jgi:uncharacterized protein YdaU (DUF1376 family)